ncbi:MULTISPECIES: long-chain fatty acid--CoA ligase [unclassified Haladaptatus]|uniref:acyl-CoA synthetase n=1 Tax=unclassified Haladaptatus TaxID=2622732 RepID=UPI0023E8BD02|nr:MULTISPECIES: long-chain fatty acid--CoA ligase [unclassified Haladaptatus]
MNLGHILRRAARRHPDRTALLGRGVPDGRTYAELDDRVDRLVAGLAELGVEAGDRVGLMVKNHAAFVETSVAAYRLGALKVPLNTMLTPGDHDHLVSDAGIDVLVVESQFAAHCAEMTARASHYVVVGEEATFPGETHAYERLLGADPDSRAEGSGDDPCALMYTSGTTGLPKGVTHTHDTWLSTALSLKTELGQRDGEVTLHAAPLTHGTGFLVESTMLVGGTNLLVDGFDPDEFLDAVDDHGVNSIFVVPTMIYKLLDTYDPEDGRDLSSLRNLYYAGAPMSAARLREGLDTFGDVFVQSYGQMECPMTITVLNHETHRRAVAEDEQLLQSAGREVDTAEVRLVDDRNEPVERGELGEITVRSPLATPGYWELPEKTAETIVDGWLHTGDVGRFDENGLLYILDRKKDMIITGGMNVYPREIEEVLATHEAVSNAAVIGVPDDYWGEKVVAVVEPRPDADVDEATLASQLEATCEAELAAYKKPKRIDIVDELPRSSYGKVRKTDLREEYWDDAERNVN